MIDPFEPKVGATVNIDVSSSSQSVSFGAAPIDQVRVMNNGTATVWIAFGSGSATATTTAGIPIGPGAAEVFTTPSNADYAAAIAAGSTGKIYFTPGSGI
jgi:hypothetical protein